jgi:hypothetical protein
LGGGGTPRILFSGDITGFYSLGFAKDSQKFGSGTGAVGLYEKTKNGYYTAATLNTTFLPMEGAEVFTKFLVRARPGSPYIPLQLEKRGEDNWGFLVDVAYGKLKFLKLFGLEVPAEVGIKAGYFDTTPADFETVSAWGLEKVMSKLRTTRTFALQVEGNYALPNSEGIALTLTTNAKFNEELSELWDNDGTYPHGTAVLDKYVIPMHVALSLRKWNLPVGPVSAEFVYAHNAEHINSGSNFGFSARGDIRLNDTITIPVGLGLAVYEKNIDVLANSAVNVEWNGLAPYDGDTTAFRGAVRGGLGAGVQAAFGDLAANAGFGLSLSKIGHLYRDDIFVPGMAFDVKAVYKERFFLGGGFILGTLTSVDWKTKEGETHENFAHTFKVEDNLGFEIYAGLQFQKSKFVLGYNLNKGLSMNQGIESIPDGQYKYNKKDAAPSDGLFERSGFFAKVVVSY